MENNLKKLLDLAKSLPESRLGIAIEKLTEIKRESEKERTRPVSEHPKCGGNSVVRNGRQSGKRQYLCKECGGSFVETTGRAAAHSHSGETVWKQAVRDTIEGKAIDETAAALDLHHETVFNMRHKILYCLEREQADSPKLLEGVCEADETYILESVKGRKIPDGYHRKARKHGAKAEKRGISHEYVRVCAAAEREGGAFSRAINRAVPSKEELLNVFTGRVSGNTFLLCDGSKNYGVLSERGKCITANASTASPGLNNINAVNAYHSFIKARNRNAGGFAAKYLNRYNALFSTAFRASDSVVDDVYKRLSAMNGGFVPIAVLQSSNLLVI
ncbi:MAG: IS1595 family transposase [Spirochaetaceae bacterium]|jgi:transposase-like protein|nr:IS1595 family transposase [Spirochaetaceae bacterium]